MSNIYVWLKAQQGARSRYDVWDFEALTQIFGTGIARRAQTAFQALWRDERPVLWSARPPDERSSTPWARIYGLCGVSSEARSPGWATCLSPDEVQVAAAYATIELNGFAPWIGDLVAAHPGEVDAVLGEEIEAELAAGGDDPYLPGLQDLTYADAQVKRLLAPRLLAGLAAWPAVSDEEAGRRWAHHLDQVLRILGDVSQGQDRAATAAECQRRFAGGPIGPLALTWLWGLFRFDPERGAQALQDGLSALADPDRAAWAIKTFALLFGGGAGVLPDRAEPSRPAAVLGRLVRCAYEHVRPADDQAHEGPIARTRGIKLGTPAPFCSRPFWIRRGRTRTASCSNSPRNRTSRTCGIACASSPAGARPTTPSSRRSSRPTWLRSRSGLRRRPTTETACSP